MASSIDWKGWKVQVESIPVGAKIQIVDTKTGEYKDAGTTNSKIDWYSSESKSYPIILSYSGKTVKVLPYSKSGKQIPKIVVDFSYTNYPPEVKKGTKVN